MSDYNKRVFQYINKNFNAQDLLVKFHNIHVGVTHTFKCPYHEDRRKSAKLFKDAFYCFACGTQYTPYKIFRNNGYSFSDLQKMTPSDFSYEKEVFLAKDNLYKVYAFSFRNDFIKTKDMRKLIANWNTIIDQESASNV